MSNIKHKHYSGWSAQSLAARIDAFLLYGTFALLMFGPLAFGAVEPWSIFTVELGALSLTLLWLAQQWLSGEITLHWNPLFSPMLVFAGLITVQIVFKRSAYRHDTLSQATLYCGYGMLCFLVTQCLRRASQARKIAVILAVYGFAIAAFALLQGVAPNGKLYWVRVPQLGGRIYGPYVNHNHYAGLMEMLVPIPLIIAISRLAHDKTRIGAAIAAAIMVATVFLCGSRGGMLSVFGELAVVAIILLRHKRTVRVAMGLAAFAVVLTSLLLWLGGQELSSKVGSISQEARGEVSGGMRLSIDKDAIRMFASRPILGWGLGTFPVVYPHFRSFYTNFFVNEAHNDYVQLAAEMGILGFGTMLWYLVLLFRHSRRKLAKWTTEISGAATLACILGIIGILLHSLVDFNLQIPANAALFYVFCTIASAPPLLQRLRKPRPLVTESESFPVSEVV